jgi:hypothetical protein
VLIYSSFRPLLAHLPAPFSVCRSRLFLGLLALAVLTLVALYQLELGSSTSVLTRAELDAGHFETGDVSAHNAYVSAHLDRCAALGLLRNTSLPHTPFTGTESTYAKAGCGLNSTTLVILSSLYFAEAYGGATFGESIWAQSVMTSLNRWGYSYMFTSQGWWNPDMRHTIDIYHKYPGQVRAVLADPEQVVVCFGEQRWNCLRSAENPDGLEEWRLLGFNFWDT